MLRLLTAGESHGPELIGVLEGVPAGFAIDVAKINRDLARRQRGYGRGGRMAIESDQARVVSGIRFGSTLGSPISIVIENRDLIPGPRAIHDVIGREDAARGQTLQRP